MDTHTLLHLIQSPESVSEAQLENLQEEVKLYPYFQAAHLLIAKADGTSEAIKRAAAYTTDRSVLMRIIKSQFNPDVNLPNIDNLDIQKEDLNAFERLDNADSALPLENIEEDADFRSQLEALAEGTEDVELEKDFDFDDNFELPANEETLVEEDKELEEEPTPEGDSSSPQMPAEEATMPTEEDDSQEVDASLLETIEAARRSRERYMSDGYASENPAEQEEEVQEEEPATPSTSMYIADEESDEVSDPDLLESLAALRKANQEAMRNREEAEARIEAMNKGIDDKTSEAEDSNIPQEDISRRSEIAYSDQEIPSDFPISDTEYPYPEYDDPFSDEAKALDQKEITDGQESHEDLFGVDTSLFELDDWLEDPKPTPEDRKATVSRSQNPVPEPEELDEMTLEERIKVQNSIINSFIEKAPNIKPKRDQLDLPEQSEDLAKKSVEDAPTFVSENLASIMVRQGKYGQAIKIYQQLMLKYPDKKAYFADLIEHLENKQK